MTHISSSQCSTLSITLCSIVTCYGFEFRGYVVGCRPTVCMWQAMGPSNNCAPSPYFTEDLFLPFAPHKLKPSSTSGPGPQGFLLKRPWLDVITHWTYKKLCCTKVWRLERYHSFKRIFNKIWVLTLYGQYVYPTIFSNESAILHPHQDHHSYEIYSETNKNYLL